MEVAARTAALAQLRDLPGHLLWRARARVVDMTGEILPPGTDLHGYAVMLTLSDEEPLSQRTIAGRCGVSGTTTTCVAEALETQGLLARTRNPRDRRSYALTRTPRGREAVQQWGRDVASLAARLEAPYTRSDVERLRGLLRRLIGDDLDPRTPSALAEDLGHLMVRAHQRVHHDFTLVLRPLGIEPREVGALRALRAGGPATQGELAGLLDVSPATVVQIVDHLEALGLVIRRRDRADRRAYRLHLGPDASGVLEQAAALSSSVIDDRLGGPDGTDRADLVLLLRRFLAVPRAA